MLEVVLTQFPILQENGDSLFDFHHNEKCPASRCSPLQSLDFLVHFRVLVLDAKILVMSHDIPSRLFQRWSYKVLSVPESHLGYDTPHTPREESADVLLSECLATLLYLGKHLLKYPKVQLLSCLPN